MVPKIDRTEFSLRQSDVHSSWIYQRTHKALLRSTGHLFRDGRWIGQEDPFHVYVEEDPPCLGKTVPVSFPSYERDGVGDFPGTQDHGFFRTCITRAYDSSRYYGPIADVRLPNPEEPSFSDFVLELNAQGTSWIKKYRPGNPSADVFQFVGELHQLPQIPIIHRARLNEFRNLASSVGNEYLNIEFGWKPFVNDLVKMYRLQRTIESKIRWLIEHNGVSIRKRREEQTITEEVVAEGSLLYPWGRLDDVPNGGSEELAGYIVGGPTGCADVDLYSFTGQCDYNLVTKKTTTTWGVGTFRYFVPDIGSPQWTEKAKKALFGSNPNPSSLWELLPWSWLVDWFGNVGDILSNASSNAVENETLTNCYAMRTIEDAEVVTISNHWDAHSSINFGIEFGFPAGEDSLIYTHKSINKLRQQASPFGFGLNWPDFSARQIAILAALGVIREKPLRRVLRKPFS